MDVRLFTSLVTASGSSSRFHAIFCDALKRYRDKTKNDLVLHPLIVDLQNCKLPSDIQAVLDKKYNIHEYIQSQSGDKSSEQWLNATFTVVASFSAALGEGVGLVFPPAKVIFAGIGVLLIAAKDVNANKDALVDVFGRIENFFKRLEIYTGVPPTDAMKELIVRIIVQVLEILALATKEIKQRFSKKFVKKLMGRTDIEDALKKLDKLTHEEALVAGAEAVKLGKSIENKTDKVIEEIQQIRTDLGGLNRGQLREKFQKWLSAPDPSINFNTARKAYHDGTAAWFTQGETFKRWKAYGSENLLWIHGKPGSGKSILSSAIIGHLLPVSGARTFYLGYFFFDFKDTTKQNNRALLSSFLIQLSAQSDQCVDALSDIYSQHGRGSQQPSEDALLQCFKAMLAVLGPLPIYLIVDAIDECPNTSKELGAPRPRQEVLKVLKELIELRLPNLHICVTSRPEFDIKNALDKLASFKLSLHDEDGQKQDIAEYVRTVVYLDEEPVMMKWGEEVKQLVIETLSKKADGMFRWVVCQLEALRECLARNVERVLSELPESLDETYERVLRGINKSNREDVYRLLQCLVVSMRPLRVEELAEVLAVDLDSDEEVPRLRPDWRWEDQEPALEAACSSLIAIVDTGHSRVVQFSHFSVKEFLISPRLADSSRDTSRYHISLGLAHTILAQACIGVLLRLGDRVGQGNSWARFPLAEYAARHWVEHGQFGNVSSRIWKGMEDLFHPNRPYFTAWLMLYDIDTRPSYKSPFFHLGPPEDWDATPLYYAALCGFHDLAEHLIVNHPQYVNAPGGRYYITPLVAALAGNYFQIAQLLFQHGADVDVRGDLGWTPLSSASFRDNPEIVEWLLDHGADPNARLNGGWTPLHLAASRGHPQVARILLERKADVNAQTPEGHTPLHVASRFGSLDVAELLLGRGVDANARDNAHSTPLHLASGMEATLLGLGQLSKLGKLGQFEQLDQGQLRQLRQLGQLWQIWLLGRPSLEVACLLLKHGADVEAKDDLGRTAFHFASSKGHIDIAKLLSEHGANSSWPSSQEP